MRCVSVVWKWLSRQHRRQTENKKFNMNLADKVRLAGVVGAGGGGFPTHVKLGANAEVVIANGAECEPLLHTDAVTMEESAVEMVRGIQLAMEAVGAREGVVGVKAKKKHAVEAAQ